MPIAAKALLFLVKTKTGRRILLAALLLIAALVMLPMIFATSVVSALAGSCRDAAQNISTSGPDGPGATPTGSSDPSEAALADIPADYLDAYRSAGQEYGLDWALVAAVGAQESDHGRAAPDCEQGDDNWTGENAVGPMQFLPSTWASEGVDATGDGTKDPCDIEDAVHSAASYLANLGAPEDYHGALCSYYGACGDSNADYANEVMAQAEEYRAEAGDSEDGDAEPDASPALIWPLISEAYAQEEDPDGGSGSAEEPPAATEEPSLPGYCMAFVALGWIQDFGGSTGNIGTGGANTGETSDAGSPSQVVEEARRYDGTDYVLGGPEACIPFEQMDCTCLTLTVFEEFGFNLPDHPQEQRAYGEPVEGEPRAGDLVIYEDPGDDTGGHAGIVTEDGGIFHCSDPERGCLEDPDYQSAGVTPIVEIRRLVEDDGGGDASERAARGREDL